MDPDPDDPKASAANGWPELPVIGPEDDADEDGAIEDRPRTVLITGASGNIGRKLRRAWADLYDLVLIDVAAGEDEPNVVVADLEEFDDDWLDLFQGVDTVVHLAANPSEFASWEELQGPNLDAVANVLHASALAGVDRVVFASSNHAMGGYRDREGPITEDLPPRPGNPYGATKLMGERLGKCCADAFDLDFIALRLGWVQSGANRPETLPDAWSRSIWLSDADCIRLFTCAVEADLDEVNFVVVNGISRNRGTRWGLSLAADVLGFEPVDDVDASTLDS